MKRLRIYLSSTFEDLKEHRAAVFAALDKAGLEVTRMEAYTSSDERPVDTCLRDVADSDLYVGIVAWRYGFIPPREHANRESKSITELEYRIAGTSGVPTLVFLAHPETKTNWPERFLDQRAAEDGGAHIEAFRSELGREKVVSFFRSPQDLAVLVLAAIMRSGLQQRPYCVPPRPMRFVARPRLTQALIAALMSPDGGHVLVQGAGGFGKTTLAIDACHSPEVLGRFASGVLWLTLGEAPQLEGKLKDLYAMATGDQADVSGIDALVAALAKALEGRSTLVVVDDVWRTEDLALLLRLRDTHLLVTTRIRHLVEATGAKWTEIPVDEMSPDQAAELLGRGLTLDSGDHALLRTLGELLGCWPLLLELANARLLEEQRERSGPLRDCIERVRVLLERRGVLGFDRRDSDARNSAIARSLDVSLGHAERSCAGLAHKAAELAIFPEDVAIPVQVLAELFGLDALDLEEEVLRPLDNFSIVRWQRDSGHIRLHDMIRGALAARLRDGTAVHRRLITVWGDPHQLPHAYAWRWYGWHCNAADDRDHLRALLLDLDWLRAKLGATDIGALVSEFEPLRAEHQMQVLQDALRLSSHILARNKSKLAGQLLARLPEGELELRQVILERALTDRQPWLRPLRPSLTLPGEGLLITFEGHDAGVRAMAVTPDERRVVSGSADHTLKLWEIESGRLLRTLHGHTDAIVAVAVTPDGMRAVSLGRDRRLKVWSLDSGEERLTLRLGWEGGRCLVVLPDGKRALTGSVEGPLKLWDLEQGTLLRALTGHPSSVNAVALDPSGQRAVSAGSDHTIRVWDLERGELVRTFAGRKSAAIALRLSHAGKRALVGHQDGAIELWDLEQGSLQHTFDTLSELTRMATMALMPDGRHLVTSRAFDYALKLWQLEPLHVRTVLMGHTDVVSVITPLSNGTRILSGSEDRTLKLWDIEGVAAAPHLDPAEPRDSFAFTRSSCTSPKHPSSVKTIALMSEGQQVVSEGGTVMVWEVASARVLSGMELPLTVPRACPNKGFLGFQGRLEVWDLSTQAKMTPLACGLTDSEFAPLVAVTVDGTRALVARRVLDQSQHDMMVFELEHGVLLRRLPVGTRWVEALAFSRDGLRALCGSNDGTLLAWNLAQDDEPLRGVGHAGTIRALALTPNAERCVSAGSDGTVRVWDLATGRLEATLQGHRGEVRCVELTADGRRALSAGDDGVLRLWDLERNALLESIERHTDAVFALALSADGRRAASASRDRSAGLWDLERAELIASFGADSAMSAVALASDDDVVIAGDLEGRVHFLQLEGRS